DGHPAGARSPLADEDSQRAALAGAVGAEQAKELAAPQLQAQTFDGREGAIADREVIQLENRDGVGSVAGHERARRIDSPGTTRSNIAWFGHAGSWSSTALCSPPIHRGRMNAATTNELVPLSARSITFPPLPLPIE